MIIVLDYYEWGNGVRMAVGWSMLRVWFLFVSRCPFAWFTRPHRSQTNNIAHTLITSDNHLLLLHTHILVLVTHATDVCCTSYRLWPKNNKFKYTECNRTFIVELHKARCNIRYVTLSISVFQSISAHVLAQASNTARKSDKHQLQRFTHLKCSDGVWTSGLRLQPTRQVDTAQLTVVQRTSWWQTAKHCVPTVYVIVA